MAEKSHNAVEDPVDTAEITSQIGGIQIEQFDFVDDDDEDMSEEESTCSYGACGDCGEAETSWLQDCIACLHEKKSWLAPLFPMNREAEDLMNCQVYDMEKVKELIKKVEEWNKKQGAVNDDDDDDDDATARVNDPLRGRRAALTVALNEELIKLLSESISKDKLELDELMILHPELQEYKMRYEQQLNEDEETYVKGCHCSDEK